MKNNAFTEPYPLNPMIFFLLLIGFALSHCLLYVLHIIVIQESFFSFHIFVFILSVSMGTSSQVRKRITLIDFKGVVLYKCDFNGSRARPLNGESEVLSRQY